MRVCIVNYAYDPAAGDPAALLDRYPSLTGWSEALLAASVATVTVVQRFSTTAHLVRSRSGTAPYEPGARLGMRAPMSYTSTAFTFQPRSARYVECCLGVVPCWCRIMPAASRDPHAPERPGAWACEVPMASCSQHARWLTLGAVPASLRSGNRYMK